MKEGGEEGWWWWWWWLAVAGKGQEQQSENGSDGRRSSIRSSKSLCQQAEQLKRIWVGTNTERAGL